MLKKKLSSRIESLFEDLERESVQTRQVEHSAKRARVVPQQVPTFSEPAESSYPPPSRPEEKTESQELEQSSKELLGWRWECDASGKFIYCGEEVYSVLGISTDRFVGRLLTRFQLSPASIDLLDEIMVTADGEGRPVDVDVDYLNNRGSRFRCA